MTLVERLRRLGAALQNTERTCCDFCFGVSGATEFEAADEIERLHAVRQEAEKALVQAGETIAALREAQAKERERCARIAETFDEGDRQTAAFVHAQNIAAAIRSDQWQLMEGKL